MSLFNEEALELLALRAASVSNAETIRQLRAEIESLKIERDKAWSINPTVSEQLLLDQLTQARTELKSLRKDAERYRWLRDSSNDTQAENLIANNWEGSLDFEIDDAIAAAPKEE